MEKPHLQNQLQEAKLIAVIRSDDKHKAKQQIERIIEKGITAIEVTYTTPGASDIIEAFRERGDVLIGAGTVISAEQAQEAVQAGAQFIVSPGFSADLAEYLSFLDTLYIPGVITPSEIMEALTFGFNTLKLFPSGAFGISYMKNLAGPFPQVTFIPTGGIHPAEVPEWLKAGAGAVGVGSQIENCSKADLELIFQV
ncbi:bifunctional 4-hydroxy-2-oxoglutarate aldolase/2-dehydro-3-deoxy-phosphogluconate aldolase [Bacillus atrophaeus]|uniref:bifunctional 4-hydroxy-2-oxoglutarate aldolase/2-dehydro-3-deoxy-phosphogluconate aldolase n=1 Tax=Bacillus atrophaeus TaxID=1452 RepID=UPI001C62DCCF|nr:bifunctional 4-hydroxy-2-oxoglutarate aldolase/2-dehydro-3-deoxy-phosphogluconate aldolase [Bacillus atrophaeus]MCY8518370.1 bifunctional 4-hydroxy-2-oxoglutarate aldolase/2-dehydro-3-deoxy-phosphogluconate aldolase [Bacillus atrophaeus]MCY8807090.1 bifunctional 4-hydroxy-2-oxoglutarate aldolase/2-dehydro-3-deoxy-phosphogluconate aldolase [Bacillus atrophaeus]MCY8837263.1 bifunctional 4-hydroxy-2-oxoglutarate aldolase/2-dehydro-3-deoxy-phosphogluconate aldolase [Bacillus atrophaeus]MCY891765